MAFIFFLHFIFHYFYYFFLYEGGVSQTKESLNRIRRWRWRWSHLSSSVRIFTGVVFFRLARFFFCIFRIGVTLLVFIVCNILLFSILFFFCLRGRSFGPTLLLVFNKFSNWRVQVVCSRARKCQIRQFFIHIVCVHIVSIWFFHSVLSVYTHTSCLDPLENNEFAFISSIYFRIQRTSGILEWISVYAHYTNSVLAMQSSYIYYYLFIKTTSLQHIAYLVSNNGFSSIFQFVTIFSFRYFFHIVESLHHTTQLRVKNNDHVMIVYYNLAVIAIVFHLL